MTRVAFWSVLGLGCWAAAIALITFVTHRLEQAAHVQVVPDDELLAWIASLPEVTDYTTEDDFAAWEAGR